MRWMMEELSSRVEAVQPCCGWVGGWEGGWMDGKGEEEQAVGMSYCGLLGGGWLGR